MYRFYLDEEEIRIWWNDEPLDGVSQKLELLNQKIKEKLKRISAVTN